MRDRRAHVHHVFIGQCKQFTRQAHLAQQRIGRVHRTLGLTRRARCVHELGDGVAAGPLGFVGCRGMEAVGERRLQKCLLEVRRRIATAHDADMLQVRQFGAQPGNHPGVVESAKALRNDQYLGVGETQHESQFTFAKDGHQRIDGRAQAHAGGIEHQVVPPTRQLHGDDIPWPDAQLGQSHRDPVGHDFELTEGVTHCLVGGGRVRDHGGALRRCLRYPIEMVDDEIVAPQTCAFHQFDAPW